MKPPAILFQVTPVRRMQPIQDEIAQREGKVGRDRQRPFIGCGGTVVALERCQNRAGIDEGIDEGWFEGHRLLEGERRLLEASQLLQGAAAIVPGRRIGRIDRERGVESGKRQSMLLQCQERGPSIA